MLKAYDQLGFKFDELYACSSGSLNAALYAAGDLDVLENLWLTISNKDVRTFTPWNLLTPRASAYDNSPLRRTLEKYVDVGKIIRRKKPVYISTTCLLSSTCKRYRLDQFLHGLDPIDILVASASPPILASPMMLGDSIHTDGGVANNYSVDAAALAGASEIVIMHPNRPGAWKIRNVFDAIDILFSVPEWNQWQHQVDCLGLIPEAARPVLKTIAPDGPTKGALYDFDYRGLDRKALIKLGFDLAYRVLSA